MSSRKVAIRRHVRREKSPKRAGIVCGIIGSAPFQSRARELVESGLIDRAARIAELAHSLTNSAIGAMEAECSERRRVTVADIRSLRNAAFEGISRNIIGRLEPRGRP